MKKKLLLFTTALLALMVLSACGGQISPETVAEVEQAVQEAAPTIEAVVQEVAPTIEAAATELAPTLEAAVEEVAPTVEAAMEEAEEMAEGEGEEMAEGEGEEMAEGEGEEMAEGEMMDGDMKCDVDLTGENIVIYQQAGREGPLAAILGSGFAYATEDVVNLINESGGVCGATISVEFGETNYDVEQEIAVYERFRVADPKPIILLTYGSGATVALKDRVFEDQIINLAAGLNAEAIYNPAEGYTVGAAPIYSDQFAGYLTWLSENWADVRPEGAGDDIVVGVIGWPNAFGAGATTPEALAVAEELGITVLPLEEIALSPDADPAGPLQNLVLGGANVVYNQSLSFSPAQVIGAAHALGIWDQILMGGVNWSMHNDVPVFLGENQALADGYCGLFPYAYWSDTDVPGVQMAIEAFEAAGRPESDRSTTYLTTFGSFLAIRNAMVHTVNMLGGIDGLTGETLLAGMQDMGLVDGDGISVYDVRGANRAPAQSQIRCMTWDGEQIQYEVVQDYFDLPDTRPASGE